MRYVLILSVLLTMSQCSQKNSCEQLWADEVEKRLRFAKGFCDIAEEGEQAIANIDAGEQKIARAEKELGITPPPKPLSLQLKNLQLRKAIMEAQVQCDEIKISLTMMGYVGLIIEPTPEFRERTESYRKNCLQKFRQRWIVRSRQEKLCN